MTLVMERGHATSAQLAERLGLTPAAVRRHLGELRAHGLVRVRQRRGPGGRGPGRPCQVYEPTAVGRGQFEQAYDRLALELLEYLRQVGGPQAISAFAQYKFASLESDYASARQAEPDLTAAAALLKVLGPAGFMADLSSLASGEQLCQHHCPYALVAERFPELCQAETEAFAKLLDSHVQRLATIAHGDGVCTTHIPFPRRKEQP
jgi:predicted ArsR family transcriptional regulator